MSLPDANHRQVEQDLSQATGTFGHMVKAHAELAKAHTKLRQQVDHERARHKRELEAETRRAKEAEAMHADVWEAREKDNERATARLQRETTKMLTWHRRYEKIRKDFDDQKAISQEQNELIRQLESQLAATRAKLAATEAFIPLTKRQRKDIDALASDRKRRRLPPSFRE